MFTRHGGEYFFSTKITIRLGGDPTYIYNEARQTHQLEHQRQRSALLCGRLDHCPLAASQNTCPRTWWVIAGADSMLRQRCRRWRNIESAPALPTHLGFPGGSLKEVRKLTGERDSNNCPISWEAAPGVSTGCYYVWIQWGTPGRESALWLRSARQHGIPIINMINLT